MDLATKTISHLAEANQQLATAHNFSLTQLHSLLTSSVLCSRCRASDSKTTSKVRTYTTRQSVSVKTPNRRVRKLRKVAAVDEIDEVDHHNAVVNEDDVLRREIEQLRADTTTKNCDLEEQRLLVRRLTEDFEVSRKECETKESHLQKVSQQLSKSELETARLLAELETFRRDEVEQTTRLKSRLAEQDEEKQKHLTIIDEANERIRALELEIEAHNQAAKQSMEVAVAATDSPDPDASSSNTAGGVSEEFKKELLLKREARQRAIAAISSEIERLRRELEAEKCAHSETAKQLLEAQNEMKMKKTDNETPNKTDSDHVEALRLSELLKISDEITSDLWLQLERTDDLRFKLENDPEEHRLRIHSLKRLSEDMREKLRVRKQQVNVLKDRLAQILVRLGDRTFLDVSDNIREEVERQAEDIARSRTMSDERSRILAELRDHCFKEIHELKVKLDSTKKEYTNLEEDLQKTDDKMEARDAEILNLESQLGLAKADCRDLQNQMTLINNLFTQMLLSASSAEMDLDRLTRLLQENHDLISDMAKENCSEAAALPKLLMDIIEQVDGRNRENDSSVEKREDDVQEENIAHNLPKVWRVLTELLSCHAAGGRQQAEPHPSPSLNTAPDSCYKSVDTPTGPRLVISVSKTYIRLKELILEKKHLEKEMNRMKQLNSHLENKLSEQEKRLSTVADELSKTWSVVGRMQAQHQQLHTHEKILRYELQQKRKMLQELKKELEYCKEKWESARQKNNNTEIEWRSLRREFAARKALAITHADSFNNSGESGFSDDREEESDEDEDERVRPSTSRRRSKKSGSRAVTPESELPTDNECSEPKSSTSASGQRTPTPETEAELENSEIIEEDPKPSTSLPQEIQNEEEIVDPLEKALSNVLQNLISSTEFHRGEESSLDFEDESDQVQVLSGTTEKLKKDVIACDKVETVLEKVESVIVNEVPKVEATLEKVKEILPIGLNVIQEEVEDANVEDFLEKVQSVTINEVPEFESTLETSIPNMSSSLSTAQEVIEDSKVEAVLEKVKSVTVNEVPKIEATLEKVNSVTINEVPKVEATVKNVMDYAPVCLNNTQEKVENDNAKSEPEEVVPVMSVFSIGPHPPEQPTVTIKNVQLFNNPLVTAEPSCSTTTVDKQECSRASSSSSTSAFIAAAELQIEARAARLKSLEEQAEWLVRKVNDTKRRGNALNSRLEVLHETYGSMPQAPPMPDVLPTFRIRTAADEIDDESTPKDDGNDGTP